MCINLVMDPNLYILKYLIDKYSDNLRFFIQGLTSLSWASRNGHPEVVQLLLDYGASIESKDNYGLFILHLTTSTIVFYII